MMKKRDQDSDDSSKDYGNHNFQQVSVLWSLKPENEIFKEESQLSEYISILVVAYVEVKLSDVEVTLFLAKITLSNIVQL